VAPGRNRCSDEFSVATQIVPSSACARQVMAPSESSPGAMCPARRRSRSKMSMPLPFVPAQMWPSRISSARTTEGCVNPSGRFGLKRSERNARVRGS